jgi:hypothetical protein
VTRTRCDALTGVHKPHNDEAQKHTTGARLSQIQTLGQCTSSPALSLSAFAVVVVGTTIASDKPNFKSEEKVEQSLKNLQTCDVIVSESRGPFCVGASSAANKQTAKNVRVMSVINGNKCLPIKMSDAVLSELRTVRH